MNPGNTSGGFLKVNNATNRLSTVLFIVYLAALLWILLFKLGVRFSYMSDRRVNLVPFNNALSNGNIDLGETIMNVIIFLPLGIYAGVLFKRWSYGFKIFFFFLTSLFFEVLQYLLSVGSFDMTDIVNNTLGGIIGLMIFVAIEKAFNNNLKTQKFINIIAITGTVLMVILLSLLKLNMLPIRYQ